MTKDDEGGRGGQPKDDEGWRRGVGGGGLKTPKLADIICEQPLIWGHRIFGEGRKYFLNDARLSMLSYFADLHLKKNVNVIHYIYEFPGIQFSSASELGDFVSKWNAWIGTLLIFLWIFKYSPFRFKPQNRTGFQVFIENFSKSSQPLTPPRSARWRKWDLFPILCILDRLSANKRH